MGESFGCEKEADMKRASIGWRALLLLPLFAVTMTAQSNPLAGLTKLHANGAGTGNTAAATGTLIGDPMGMATFTFSFNVALETLTSNGQGGNCDRGSGNLIMTAADGSTIQMQHAGLSCNTGVGVASPATSNLTYIITSGTGRFSDATGTGNVVVGQYHPAQVVLIHFDGNIKFR
jgi:hypothetical protein